MTGRKEEEGEEEEEKQERASVWRGCHPELLAPIINKPLKSLEKKRNWNNSSYLISILDLHPFFLFFKHSPPTSFFCLRAPPPLPSAHCMLLPLPKAPSEKKNLKMHNPTHPTDKTRTHKQEAEKIQFFTLTIKLSSRFFLVQILRNHQQLFLRNFLINVLHVLYIK